MGMILIGDLAAAKPLVHEAWGIDSKAQPEIYIYLFAKLGNSQRAQNVLDSLDSNKWNHGYVALGQLALGDMDAAFHTIENGINEHNNSIASGLRTSPLYAGLRDDPRFNAMVTLLRQQETFTSRGQ